MQERCSILSYDVTENARTESPAVVEGRVCVTWGEGGSWAPQCESEEGLWVGRP
jgi:hypothetical protein